MISSKFLTKYQNLSSENKSILFKLLVDLEHNCEKSKELMALTLQAIIYENGMNTYKIVKEIQKAEYEKSLTEHSIKEGVSSAIKRYSTNSSYFKDILKIIGIDEAYVENESYSYRSTYLYNLWENEYKEDYPDYVIWLFDTLSEQNQRAVYSLAYNLNNINIFKNISNLPCINNDDYNG